MEPSNQKSLLDSINKVQDSVQRKEQKILDHMSSQSTRGRLHNYIKYAAGIMVLAALVYVKIFIINYEEKDISNDFKLAAMDLFMEADASVLAYYQAYRELPDALPLSPLREYIQYNKLDESEYTLQVVYVPYNKRINRDVESVIYPTDLEKSLDL